MFPRHFRVTGEPRACVLHKGKRGFGFVLRGAKAASPLMEMIPSDKCPGLQYLDDVDPGGVADLAGIDILQGPAPGALALLGLAGLGARRRR